MPSACPICFPNAFPVRLSRMKGPARRGGMHMARICRREFLLQSATLTAAGWLAPKALAETAAGLGFVCLGAG